MQFFFLFDLQNVVPSQGPLKLDFCFDNCLLFRLLAVQIDIPNSLLPAKFLCTLLSVVTSEETSQGIDKEGVKQNTVYDLSHFMNGCDVIRNLCNSCKCFVRVFFFYFREYYPASWKQRARFNPV